MEYLATINPDEFKIKREALIAFAEEFFGKEVDQVDMNGIPVYEEEQDELILAFTTSKEMHAFLVHLVKNFRKTNNY